MIESDWNTLRQAIEMLQNNSGITKFEGLLFTAYKVGLIIRVDIKAQS